MPVSQHSNSLLVSGGNFLVGDISSAGLILSVDLDDRNVQSIVKYRSPNEVVANDVNAPSILFKSATVKNGFLYGCTTTELLVYRLSDFNLIEYVTHPCFNDVHHVNVTSNDSLLVANTGLDMVVEIDKDGKLLSKWHAGSKKHLSGKFSEDVDYRRIDSTKPHVYHPNYVFEFASKYWVTRCHTSDVICLQDRTKKLRLSNTPIHDGAEFDGLHYFTSVNGHIIVADLKKMQVINDFNLNNMSGKDLKALGWCRGLCVLDRFEVIVGFTRLRPTKWRENVQWAKNKLHLHAGTEHTRIVKYDLLNEALLWEIDLEKHDLASVFSIHRLNASGTG